MKNCVYIHDKSSVKVELNDTEITMFYDVDDSPDGSTEVRLYKKENNKEKLFCVIPVGLDKMGNNGIFVNDYHMFDSPHDELDDYLYKVVVEMANFLVSNMNSDNIYSKFSVVL